MEKIIAQKVGDMIIEKGTNRLRSTTVAKVAALFGKKQLVLSFTLATDYKSEDAKGNYTKYAELSNSVDEKGNHFEMKSFSDILGIEPDYIELTNEAYVMLKAAEDSTKAEAFTACRKALDASPLITIVKKTLELNGFTVTHPDLDKVAEAGHSTVGITAVKNGVEVSIGQDGKVYVISVGYDRDDKRRTTSVTKILGKVNDLLEIVKNRKARNQSEAEKEIEELAFVKQFITPLGEECYVKEEQDSYRDFRGRYVPTGVKYNIRIKTGKDSSDYETLFIVKVYGTKEDKKIHLDIPKGLEPKVAIEIMSRLAE